MAETAADILIDTIHDWGVEVVFGLPGDGINGIMEALRKRQDDVRFVQVRHRSEEHTSELQSLMRISYAVFCLKKKTTHLTSTHTQHSHNIYNYTHCTKTNTTT